MFCTKATPLALLLLAWYGSTTLAADAVFKLEPSQPEAGKPFTVALLPSLADSTTNYKWDAIASKATPADLFTEAEAGIPVKEEELNRPTLAISKAAANSNYTISLSYTRRNITHVVSLRLQFDAAKLVAKKELDEDGKEIVAAGAEPPAAPVRPPPLPESKASVQTQLSEAKKWAEEVAKFQKTDNLIVSVDFIETHLKKRREVPVPGSPIPGESSLWDIMDRPLLDAAKFHRAVENATKALPSDAEQAAVEQAWAAEKEKFLTALITENAEAQVTAQFWRLFLSDWEAEVKRVAPTRFRDALIEAPLVLTAILLGFEREHILNAMTGGARSRADAGGGGQYTDSGFYGASHAAVHHARAMARIRMRSERRLARIRGY